MNYWTMKASRLFSLVGCLGALFSTSSLTVPSAVANTFSTGFESGPPPGTALFGSAFVDSTGGVNGSGVLKLTKAGNALQGSFIYAKAKSGPDVARSDLAHLKRYLETLFPTGK